MRYSAITERLKDLGGTKWALHARARQMKASGQDIIELTIGEPDLPCPEDLIESAVTALRSGRLGYSNGRGEPALRDALAAVYTARSGRAIGPSQIIAFPGTQTALFAALQVMAGSGDEVLIGDPMYATYEGLIAASGGRAVHVPLQAENQFILQTADVAKQITPRTRVLFLNSPHNPTGAILPHADIEALGRLAVKNDLWILSDEVYSDMIFPGEGFVSPLDFPEFAERTVVASSISKSHAAPGLRSGWCIGPTAFCDRLLPLSESMLFGNQPFIADATVTALSKPSVLAAQMAAGFARRAALVAGLLDGVAGLGVNRPRAGMFVLADVRATGWTGARFAETLLDNHGVAVMPGCSFGRSLAGWVRISLTQPDAVLTEACGRIAAMAQQINDSRGAP
jgi:arginine:pyruvate transaminase